MTQPRISARDFQERRYWGARESIPSKGEFFNAITTPAPAGDGTVATIRMYGPIDSWGGWWGISAEDMSKVLDQLDDTVDHIILRINSPGGEVWEGLAILNMLRAHKARVTAVVDALAASAASVIAAGCDEVVMSPGTQMMIHSPWSWVIGPATDMRKQADFLDKIEASIIEVYSDKAGEQDWAQLLADETWLTGPEAVDLGLADRVAVIPDAGETSTVGDEPDELITVVMPDGDPEDSLTARVAASARRAAPAATAGNTTTKGGPDMEPDQFTQGIRDRLGLPADTTPEDALAALDARLQDEPAAAIIETLPDGVVTIEADQLEQLRADAAAGREAREQQIRAERDAAVAAAVADGRIAPARADHWREQLAADPGALDILNALQPGLIPLDERGITGGVDESGDDSAATDVVYSKLYPTPKKEG